MMGRICRLWIAFLALFGFQTILVAALPTGAAGCAKGKAAVRGTHLFQATIVTGGLELTNMTLTVGSTTYQPGANITLTAGAESTITLNKGSKPFKGFLLRVAGRSGFTLTPDASSARVANVCLLTRGTGITHFSPLLKDSASGTLVFQSAKSNVALDVTVVMQNSGGLSEYYYSGFTINVV